MPTLPSAPAPVVNNPFQQHPDDLIKKVDRKPAPVAETPEAKEAAQAADDAEEAAFKELKAKLPSVLFGDKPKAPVVDPSATPAPAKVTPEPAAKVVPDPAAVPEVKKVKVTRQPTAAEFAEATSQELARRLEERLKTAPEPAKAAPEPVKDETPTHLSAADKENYELFKTLADTEPDRYKDSHTKFLTFVDKLAAYKKKWEKENAGETFNPDDHEDFYSKNQPAFTGEDLQKARVRREVARETGAREVKMRKEYEDRLAEVEARAVGPQVEQQGRQMADHATAQFVAQLGDDAIKTALTSKGGDELKNTDPVAFDVLNTHASQLQHTVAELHNIVNRKNYFNPSNPVHKDLASFIENQERTIKAMPGDKQVFEGKLFATRDEFYKLPAQQRERHWTLTEPDVVHMLTQVSALQATKALVSERQRLETMATKYGFVKPPASQATQKANPTPSVTAPAKPAKPAAPSAEAGAAGAPLAAQPNVDDKPIEKKLVSALW